MKMFLYDLKFRFISTQPIARASQEEFVEVFRSTISASNVLGFVEGSIEETEVQDDNAQA
jgi:hypothetical protein